MWDLPNQFLVPFLSSKMVSISNLIKLVISPQNFIDFTGGKYLVRNLFAISSYIAIDSFGKDLNHIHALSLSEKGKSSISPSPLAHRYIVVYHKSLKSLQYAHMDHH